MDLITEIKSLPFISRYQLRVTASIITDYPVRVQTIHVRTVGQRLREAGYKTLDLGDHAVYVGER